MALTPRSMRSPVSPCDSQSKTSLHVRAPYYPPTPQPEPSQGTPETNRGLGLLGCNFPQQHGTVHGLPPSPQPLDAWSRHPMTEPFRQPPDISSAEYDPFSGFSTASSTGMLSTSSPDPPGLVYCQTPQSMQLPSHRSSISSSCSPIDAFSQHGSEYLCTPRVKIEEARNWYPSAGSLLRKSPTSQDLGTYSTVVSPISASEDGIYKPIHAATWPRADTTAYPATLQASSESQPSLFPPASILPSVERTKKKRQPTTPEEATHECRICGKLFKRSYNWKSHLETHNPDRKYPHPCTFTNGNTQCTKRFQRKTDLDRHYDSVRPIPPRLLVTLLIQIVRCISRRATMSASFAVIASLAVTRSDGQP